MASGGPVTLGPADEKHPTGYPHPAPGVHLITPVNLHNLLEKAKASKEKENGRGVVLLEAGSKPFKPSKPGPGIPGAMYLNVHELEVWTEGKLTMGSGNLKPWPQLLGFAKGEVSEWAVLHARLPTKFGLISLFHAGIIEGLGITAKHTVVVYCRHAYLVDSEDHKSSHHPPKKHTKMHNDPISAARLIWALSFAGVEDVAYLDGGLEAWREAKLPTAEKFRPRPKSRADFFATSSSSSSSSSRRKSELQPGNVRFLATTEDVEVLVDGLAKNNRKNGATKGVNLKGGLLADVRAWEEHTGVKQQYTFLSTLGRIPGSRWALWGPSTYVGGDFWETDSGRLRDLREIEAWWKKMGIHKPTSSQEKVIFYCGSGWRSSMGWFVARLLGWEHVSNYDGGWLEWVKTHPRAAQHRYERPGVCPPPSPPLFPKSNGNSTTCIPPLPPTATVSNGTHDHISSDDGRRCIMTTLSAESLPPPPQVMSGVAKHS